MYTGAGAAFPRGGIVVVDEVSQVPLEDFVRIMAMNTQGTTICTGDESQLAPPEGTPVWDWLRGQCAARNAAYIQLTKNIRSETPSLTDFINRVRATGQLPDIDVEGVHIHASADEFHAALLQRLSEDAGANTVALAYRNATVDYLTNLIREKQGFKPGEAGRGEILRLCEDTPLVPWTDTYHRLLDEGCSREEAFRAATQITSEERLHNGDTIRILYAAPPCMWGAPWASPSAVTR
jgi:hypothetical protein